MLDCLDVVRPRASSQSGISWWIFWKAIRPDCFALPALDGISVTERQVHQDYAIEICYLLFPHLSSPFGRQPNG
jgi:hypothetical protein